MLRTLAAFIVLLCTQACSFQETPMKEVKLPSGRVVKIITVGRMNFSKAGPALMLKYQTDLKVTDIEVLRKEVEEIWATFRVEAEQAKLRNAIVSANEKQRGTLAKTGNSYSFVFIQQQDGSWRSADNKPRPPQ